MAQEQMALDADYYNHLALEYRELRDTMVKAVEGRASRSPLEEAHNILDTGGLLCDLEKEEQEFAVWLAEEVGVATVPGMSAYQPASPSCSLTISP